MKKTLLQGFDPLPKSLSTKGLLALVGIVVLGTAITVERYVDSSKGPVQRAGSHSLFDGPSEVRAAPKEESGGSFRVKSNSREYGFRNDSGSQTRSRPWSGSCAERVCPRTEGDATSATTPTTTPSRFRPGADAPGS
jgi:hypothetical protein